jgi:hypothetical protein
MTHVRVQGDEASGRWHVMVAMVDAGVSKLLVGLSPHSASSSSARPGQLVVA